MRLQIWHGGWWLTNPHPYTSQHASVIDSSWRPDLTKVSTTTTAQEELCTANGEAYVSTQGHRLAHTESISPMKHMSMNSNPTVRQKETTQHITVYWYSSTLRCELCTHCVPIHRGDIISCQQNGSCCLYLSDLYGSERESDSRCRVAGKVSRSPAVGIVWDCCSTRVCKQKLLFSVASGAQHKAICNE